jgi:uncharacterized membrane protein YagU involved in acid resistance
MVSGKRLVVTTVLGLLAGLVTLWWMHATSTAVILATEAAAVILSRTILGFAIGLSGWRLNWALHGAILGIVFSLPQSFFSAWNGHSFWAWLISGLVIGFLIELLSTPIFHLRRPSLELPHASATV